jgi:hypothetical protein
LIIDLIKIEIEGMYLNKIKSIYDKPIASIILNEGKQKTLPVMSLMIQRCPLSPLLLNIPLEF